MKHLEHILRCPVTRGALRELGAAEIEEANNRIARGALLRRDGTLVRREIGSGFISSDCRFLYPVEDGIVILLQNLAIVLDERNPAKDKRDAALRSEKQDVQLFYDEIGWQGNEEDGFVDTQRYEDLRPVSMEYVQKCRLRVKKYIKPAGGYILDVASGPIQFPEYRSYSSSYEIRICIDLSFRALREAKRKLGSKCVYLLADVTNLPLKNDVVDAVVSLHTIYHVPKEEQRKAFEEIYRVLAPRSSAVIVYSWGPHSPLMNLTLFPLVLIRGVRRLLRRVAWKRAGMPEPKLYAYMHDYGWFVGPGWRFDLDIVSWRSLSHHFSKVYIHPWLFGRQILKVFTWLEDRWPRLMGRLGQYPMLIIRK
jgi:ubiquinone/menaquinone biosynthesis C-methylase UbiE/uncharacterized protein YbaR (Trm112 family)